MSNNKIFPARRFFPVIEQIRELYCEAAEVPGAEEQVVVDKATLEVLYAAALELERNTPTLVVVEATFGEDEKEEEALRFLNHYKCPNCSSEWSVKWECQVDDECGECGTRHVSPYASEDA